MPSPIGHLAFWPLLRRQGLTTNRTQRRLWGLMIAVALLAPDFDVALAFVYQTRISQVHNGPTHSLLAALVFALPVAGLGTWLTGVRYRRALVVMLAGYLSHLLLDIFTWGRGIELFWPLTHTRIASPVPLFLGVRHSSGAPLWMHVLTAANDLMFFAVVAALAWGWRRRRNHPQARPPQSVSPRGQPL